MNIINCRNQAIYSNQSILEALLNVNFSAEKKSEGYLQYDNILKGIHSGIQIIKNVSDKGTFSF